MADEKRAPGQAGPIKPPAEGQRYPSGDPTAGSPQASDPNPMVTASSPRAMMEEVARRVVAEMLGRQGEDAAKIEAEIARGQKAEQERARKQAERAAERIAKLVQYRAKGDRSRIVGEIPVEQPGGGRRAVYGQELFMFAGRPARSWMEAVDAEGEKRLKEEDERHEAVRKAAGASESMRARYRHEMDLLEGLVRSQQLQAAEATDFRAGSGG